MAIPKRERPWARAGRRRQCRLGGAQREDQHGVANSSYGLARSVQPGENRPKGLRERLQGYLGVRLAICHDVMTLLIAQRVLESLLPGLLSALRWWPLLLQLRLIRAVETREQSRAVP
jgi:hypothetical protein